MIYFQLRARRVLLIFKDVLFRTWRGLSLYNVYGNIRALLVLNGTFVNSDSALLALNWWYMYMYVGEKIILTVAVGMPESSLATRKPLLSVETFVSGTLTNVCLYEVCVDLSRLAPWRPWKKQKHKIISKTVKQKEKKNLKVKSICRRSYCYLGSNCRRSNCHPIRSICRRSICHPIRSICRWSNYRWSIYRRTRSNNRRRYCRRSIYRRSNSRRTKFRRTNCRQSKFRRSICRGAIVTFSGANVVGAIVTVAGAYVGSPCNL